MKRDVGLERLAGAVDLICFRRPSPFECLATSVIGPPYGPQPHGAIHQAAHQPVLSHVSSSHPVHPSSLLGRLNLLQLLSAKHQSDSVVASKRARGATRPFQSRELARRIATGKERRTTYRSCAEKSSLVSSSSHDSSHRCCVSPPLAASVSSASQSACTTLSVILSWDMGGKGWEGKKGAHTLNREILKLVILLQSGGALLLLGGRRRHGRLVGRFGVFLLLLGGCGGHGCFGCGHGGGRRRRRWEVVLWWGWWW